MESPWDIGGLACKERSVNAPEPLFSTRLRHRSKQNIVFQNIYIKMPDDDRVCFRARFQLWLFSMLLPGFIWHFLIKRKKKKMWNGDFQCACFVYEVNMAIHTFCVRTSNFRLRLLSWAVFFIFWQFQPQIVLKLFLVISWYFQTVD